MNRKGFTLIELMVVVLIIGILASVALPQYKKAINQARMVDLMTKMDNIAKDYEVAYLESREERAGNLVVKSYKNIFDGSGGIDWNRVGGTHFQFGSSSGPFDSQFAGFVCFKPRNGDNASLFFFTDNRGHIASRKCAGPDCSKWAGVSNCVNVGNRACNNGAYTVDHTNKCSF